MNEGAVFIDLWPVLAEETTGKMKRDFTTDGLHLSGAGYKAWAEAVRPFVEGLIPTPVAPAPEDEETEENLPEEAPISIIKIKE